MAKECDNISTGSVLEKFELISYDKDAGRMMVSYGTYTNPAGQRSVYDYTK